MKKSVYDFYPDIYPCPVDNYNCPWYSTNGGCMLDRPQDVCETFMIQMIISQLAKKEDQKSS